MPGLTKIATEGQPITIVKDLEDMCKQYIKVRVCVGGGWGCGGVCVCAGRGREGGVSAREGQYAMSWCHANTAAFFWGRLLRNWS